MPEHLQSIAVVSRLWKGKNCKAQGGTVTPPEHKQIKDYKALVLLHLELHHILFASAAEGKVMFLSPQ